MSTHKPHITLLVSCPDQRGIVSAISGFICKYNGNIIESDQHATRSPNGTFFMRVSFDAEGFALDQNELPSAFQPIADHFQIKWSVHYSQQRKRAAILVSKLDHCLVDLLWRWKSGELKMDIPFIISNHPDLEPLAQMYGLPYYHFPLQRATHVEDEQRILEFIRGKVDFLILARYMQILDPFFVAEYPSRIINIHHSFLPAFIGANPYHRAFDRGVKLIGATAHYVTDNLDEGPILAQDVIRCNHRDTVEDLVRKGKDVERRVLTEAVQLHIEDRVQVYQNKTVVF